MRFAASVSQRRREQEGANDQERETQAPNGDYHGIGARQPDERAGYRDSEEREGENPVRIARHAKKKEPAR